MMRFKSEIHYAGCRTSFIEATSQEGAERLARERHHATAVGGPGDIEEITWVQVMPQQHRDVNADEGEDADAIEANRFAAQIGTCPGCGMDVSYGANEDCVDAEGCGALNGSAILPYELARLRGLLRRYVTAIDDGSYEDARQAIRDVAGDLRILPGRGGKPIRADGVPDALRFTVDLSLDDHVRAHVGLTLSARAILIDPAYVALRDRIDKAADRALLSAGSGS